MCLAEFEKRNCIIKKVIGPANSISNSQMLSNSQPEFPSSQHIPSQSATQQTFSPMINRASIQKAQTAFSPIAPASVPQGTEIFEFQPAQSGIQNNIPSSAVENSLPSMQLGDLNDIEISNYICDCLCDPKFVKLVNKIPPRVFVSSPELTKLSFTSVIKLTEYGLHWMPITEHK